MRSSRLRATTVGLALILAGVLTSARAEGHELNNLQVTDGTTWHASSSFHVEWEPPDRSYIVHWSVLTATGAPLQPPISGEDSERWAALNISVPPVPGVYLFSGQGIGIRGKGAVTTVPLYFDNARPGEVSIEAPAWVAPGDVAQVHLSPPRGPMPISGIHGYALSIDGAATGSPCVAADRCAVAEIDLPGGIADSSAGLRAPAEGVAYVHASAVSESGMRSPTATRAIGVDGTPPQVRLDGAPAGWTDRPVRLTAIATDPLSGNLAAGPDGPITALAIDGRPPAIEPGDRVSATVSGDGVHRVAFYGRDALGNSGDGSLPFASPGTASIRIDESDPAVRFAAPDPGDPERIEAIVADPLSGPDPDRGSIAVRAVGSPARFQPLPTAIHRGHLVARWSSDDFPRGPYEFRAVGFDLAGNAKTTNLGGGGDAFVLQNPVKREARLAFGFGAGRLVYQRCSRADGSRRCHRAEVRSFARRPPARTVPCCHGALVGGRLVDAGGAPLAGQSVEVIETFADGARNGSRRTVLTSDADGSFSTRLAPGPSREITAEFPGTGRLTRAAGRQIRLRVRAGVHLRVSTGRVEVGGSPVVFSGRIAHPEAPLPASGLPVQLQFRLPGMPWTEFRTVQSDAFGRFRYPYSFSDDDSAGVRFQFRASLAAAAGGWPFAPATSRPVAVTG